MRACATLLNRFHSNRPERHIRPRKPSTTNSANFTSRISYWLTIRLDQVGSISTVLCSRYPRKHSLTADLQSPVLPRERRRLFDRLRPYQPLRYQGIAPAGNDGK